MSDATKILIIDDSEDDRLLYRRALAKGVDATYDIFDAEEGEAGLGRIAKEAPDCVLLDYSLPGRNGVEVLKRLRAAHPFVPVVMLTGQGNETIAVAAIQAGAQNYLSKGTISTETIERAIRVAIDHCALQRRIHDQQTSLEIFTRALAHDLKEPVRTISSFLDLLTKQETLSPKGSGYFNHIAKAADRMADLIDAVFSYTKLDSSSEATAKEVCDVAAVLADVTESVGELIRERQARITHDALPLVQANRVQMLQILQNLVCNAIRYAPGQPAIHIDAVEQGDRWMIRVADNGPGIEEAQRQKIFEPFKRLTKQGGGLGLGLAICKRIVELHGGKIWHEPAQGGGSIFCFTLPKAAGDVATMAAAVPVAAVGPATASGSNQGALANILVVDDSEADLELTRILLIEQGGVHCNLLTARDAGEAMAALSGADRPPVDLVLLDINMPGIDGLELLKKIRDVAALRDLPVVMCTTSGYDKDMEQAKALGATGYLQKPADLARLRPTLDKIAHIRLAQVEQGYAIFRAA
ncbi:MAG: response regulator [Alphaproteobacteria bacterium]|nr:response regulator [Alphaproteobacteria bacterium]